MNVVVIKEAAEAGAFGGTMDEGFCWGGGATDLTSLGATMDLRGPTSFEGDEATAGLVLLRVVRATFDRAIRNPW